MALFQNRWILPQRNDPRSERCADIASWIAWIEPFAFLVAWLIFMQPTNGGTFIDDIPFLMVNAAVAGVLLCIGLVGLRSRSSKKVGSMVLITMNGALIVWITIAFLGFRSEVMNRSMTEQAEDVQPTAAAQLKVLVNVRS
jgi:hypothetical protein